MPDLLFILSVVLCSSILILGMVISTVELKNVYKWFMQQSSDERKKCIKNVVLCSCFVAIIMYPFILYLFGKLTEHAPLTS